MKSASTVMGLVFLGATVFASACSSNPNSLKVKTTDGKVETIARYKTYARTNAKEAPSTFAKGDLTPEVLDAVGAAVDRDLQGKGYVAGGDASDLVVRISSGTREAPSGMGGSARAGAAQDTDTQRGIVVDIFERRSDEQLFHGYARYGAAADVIDEDKIREAVTSTLATVPRSTAN